MGVLSITFLLIAILAIIVMVLVVIFAQGPSTGGIETLKTREKPNDGENKEFHEMTYDDIMEFTKECRRIDNDHSLEKKYIRFCLDELTEYPSDYVLILKESEPLPDYSEKGLMETPSFRDVCAKIKDLVKLEGCAYIDPKVCKLPFHVSNLEGGCDSFSEICDGSNEPYVSFWLKKYNV